MTDKIPPQDLDAERAVIGAVLHEPESLLLVPELLVEHFYSTTHRDIFDEMCKAERFDETTLAPILKERGLIKSVVELYKFRDAVPSSAMIQAHSSIVIKHAHRRNLISSCETALREAYEGDPLELSTNLIESLSEKATTSGYVQPKTFQASFKEWEEHKDVPGHSTGIQVLDEELGGGAHFGGITLIGGDSGAGKTALALGAVRASIGKKDPVYFVSQDQADKDITGRIYLGVIRANKDSLLVQREKGIIQDWRVDYHKGSFGLDDVCNHIKQHIIREGTKLWIVDFLQLLEVKGPDKDYNKHVIAAQRLNVLAQTTNTAGLVISRVNKGEQGMSTQHRLSGGAGIQNASDAIIFVHQMEKENGDSGLKEFFHPDAVRGLEIAKNRHGTKGVVFVKLAGDQHRFVGQDVPMCDDEKAWSPVQSLEWSKSRSKKGKR